MAKELKLNKSKKGATSSHTIAAKGGCLQHNRRTQVSQNVIPVRTKYNVSWESDKIKNRKQLRGLKERAEKLYTEKTGQKCQKSFAPYKESCVVLKDDSTLEEAQKFAEMVEAGIPGIECLGIWIHKDEGHYKSRYIEGDQDFKCNTHAHFLWYCQNPNTGKAIPIKRQDMRNMQDWAAAAFGMERGIPAIESKAEHMQMTDYKLMAMEQQLDKLQTTLDSLSATKETKEATLEAIRTAKEKVLSWFGESESDKQIKEQEKTIRDYKRTIIGLMGDNEQLKKDLAEAQKSAKSAASLYMGVSGDIDRLQKQVDKLREELRLERRLQDRRASQIISDALNIPIEQARLLVDGGEQVQDRGMHR